jgi:hypothetical protein
LARAIVTARPGGPAVAVAVVASRPAVAAIAAVSSLRRPVSSSSYSGETGSFGGSALAGTLSSSVRIAARTASRVQSIGSRSSGTRKTSRDHPAMIASTGGGSSSSSADEASGFATTVPSSRGGMVTGIGTLVPSGGLVVKNARSAMC